MTESSVRKPISKKMRFDVFKRDSFACMYCGQHPPKVILEVDHITPVFEGGKNRLDNLITACFDCNRGKGKHSLEKVPDSLNMLEKVAKIKESELQLKAYRKVLGERDERLKKDVWTVVHELYSPNKNEIPRKDFNSIKVFVEKLNLEDVVRAARKAVINKGEGSKFLFVYFCGICWRQIKEDNNEGTN
jgi:hypothetical protein